MYIHVLGICGTFTGSLVVLAKELGHRVADSDANVYPSMSTQLQAQGTELTQDYDSAHLEPVPDLVVVGNALSHGNPATEYILNKGLPCVSDPQRLADHVLQGRWVLVVAGIHGKTTITGMLAWALEHAGMNPGSLIGGVSQNFGVSVRLGDTPFFVVEADEYGSAFFDKRSRFIHYHPRTAILNNLEFDRADIFPSLAVIEWQSHHLVYTVPGEGLIIRPSAEKVLEHMLGMDYWIPVQTAGEGDQWQARLLAEDGSRFEVLFDSITQGEADWPLTGLHNAANALASLAAAYHIGVMPSQGAAALSEFRNVKRRMGRVVEVRGVTLYDDFAHHPITIATTPDGLHKQVDADTQVIAIVEPRSNSMRFGAHHDGLLDSMRQADQMLWYASSNLGWDLVVTAAQCAVPSQVCDTLEAIAGQMHQQARSGAQVVIMSNGSFGGLHGKLAVALAE